MLAWSVHLSGASRRQPTSRTALILHMREAAPDQAKGDTSSLHLRIASQVLRDQGLTGPLPERLWRIVPRHRL